MDSRDKVTEAVIQQGFTAPLTKRSLFVGLVNAGSTRANTPNTRPALAA
jgi:hypothetical protein